MRLESIGQSFEGRDIWLVTVTTFETGPDLEKPAFLVEANIHAIEVTGCTAALHLAPPAADRATAPTSASPARSTRARSTSLPRLNPDGAELALADRPRFVRSSVRPVSAGRPPGRPARGGPRRRRPDPDDAHARRQRRVEACTPTSRG